MAKDLSEIVESAAKLNPETAFERGWSGGRAFERERCAKIADDMAQRNVTMSTKTPTAYTAALDIATAIRNKD